VSAFLNALHLSEIDDLLFQVIDLPFRYESDIFGGTIEVPVGFQTDFASVPRLGTLYAVLGDCAHQPAVIHDWLYYAAITTRKMADDIMLEGMGVIGLTAWKRYPIWWGIRLGGWYAWNQHRNAGHSRKDFH
jgi:hypothetical protein